MTKVISKIPFHSTSYLLNLKRFQRKVAAVPVIEGNT
jgi:hypothetical protein